LIHGIIFCYAPEAMKNPIILLIGALGCAQAGEDAVGYEWPGVPRAYGIVTEDSFGAGVHSYEADYDGDKAGLADVNPGDIDFRLQSYFGYHTNPGLEIRGFNEESWYGGLRFSAAQKITSSPLSVYWGASIRHTFYDTEIFNRERGDASGTDFSARFGLQYDVSPSVSFSTFNKFDYLAHLDFNHGAHRYGLQGDDVLRYESNNAVDFRFDGGDLGSTGFESKFSLDYLRYEGHRWDQFDTDRWRATYHLRNRLDQGFRVGALLGYGGKDWDDQRDFDSKSFYYGLSADGEFGCGVGWDFRIGGERRTYRDSMIRDRDEPFASLRISGEINESTYLRYEAYYGIGDYYQNMGGNEYNDPLVLRNSLSLVHSFGSWVGQVNYSHQYVDPDIDAGGPSASRQDLHTIGVGFHRQLYSDWRVGANVGVGWGDYGFGGNDEYRYRYGEVSLTRHF